MIPAQSEFVAAAWSQLWQVTVLALAVGLLTRLVARNRPHLAHVLWLVVLLKCVTPPWCASPGGVFSWAEAWCNGPPTADADDLPKGLHVAVGPWPGTAEIPLTFSPTASDASTFPASVDGGWTTWAVGALLAAWGLGVVVAASVAGWRWANYLRRLRRSRPASNPAWDRHLASLAERLGIRRHCRLLVTANPMGPAVVGFLRHTIVLPESLLRRRTIAELEPILAHELIHARRGDAWIGLLRMLVQSVWWFHPLVHWASRVVAREAERCCDEEVVAALGLKPADYARCLLDVLEQKQTFTPVPAFPGIHPVEAVSKRMERIMRLRQGSHRRTPWWCWVVMVLVAGATLPGAAWVAADGEEAKASPLPEMKDVVPCKPRALPDRARPNGNPYGVPTRQLPPASINGEEIVWCTYTTEDVLRVIQMQDNLGEEAAKAKLLLAITESMQKPKAFINAGKDPATGTEYAVPAPESGEELPVAKDGFRWMGTQLLVGQTHGVHERVIALLESLRQQTEQVRIDVHFIWGQSVTNHLANIHWSMSADATSDDGASSPAKPTPALVAARPGIAGERPVDGVRARMVIERRLPAMFAVCDAAKADKILKDSEKDRIASAMQAPSMMMHNGQWVFVSDCSQSPFVVGVKEVTGPYGSAQQPQINVVSEGTTLHMRPLLQKDNRVRLECRLALAKIERVDTATFNVATSSSGAVSGTTIQCPVVAKQEVDTGVEMALGQTLAIGGVERPSDAQGKPQPMLILIRPTKVEKKTAVAALSAQ